MTEPAPHRAGNAPDGSEVALVAATAAGDTLAFERLYRLHERRVWRYAVSMVQDRAVADELVVDTMLAVWQGASGFRSGSRVSTWILGITRHKALDAGRRSARRRNDIALDDAGEIVDEAAGPARIAEQDDKNRLFNAATAQLSAEHREALHLAFVDGLPYDEIAQLLDVPENTVKTRIHYAKRKLQDLLVRLTQEEAPY